MSTEIQVATRLAYEKAHLMFADQQLVALLVPAQEGWYFQIGLGPCEREGLIFATLDAAATWVRGCFNQGSVTLLSAAGTTPLK